MEYFKINNNDYSSVTSSLKVTKDKRYNAQTNAAGDTVADYLSTKRTIEVTIIALDEEAASSLLAELDTLSVTVAYRDATTRAITEANCLIPSHNIEYYTIRSDRVLCKAFNLKFTEL